jgi:copper(I)-binding protein
MNMKYLSRVSVALFATLCIWSAAVSAAGTAADAVMIKNAYVRAVPPGQPNSAAFLMLMNSSGSDHAVVGGESPVAKVVELHEHIHQNGMMKMRQIPRIGIKANDKTILQPGGLHIMLIGLKQELKKGEKVSLTLKFEDGSTKTVEAPVRSVMGGMKMKGMGGMKGM